MPRKLIIVFAVSLFLLFPIWVIAQERVYSISVDGHAQTGFKVKGMPGIVTALHGMIGFKRVLIANDDHSELYKTGIFIEQIDIPNDVCVLNSPEINKIPINAGFEDNKNYHASLLKGALVFVNGYPFGLVSEKSTRAYLDNFRPVKKLQECLPVTLANKLINKNSPDLNVKVFDINGSIAPGHSGSPLLLNNQVIGIVNGGLYNGQVGFAWAIVFADLGLKPFKNDKIYQALKPESLLFSFEFAPEPQLDSLKGGQNELLQTVNEILKQGKKQFTDLRGLRIGDLDNGNTARYLSKVNYFNAIRTVINVRKTGSNYSSVLNCTLIDQENKTINDSLLSENLLSEDYRIIERNYQDVVKRFQSGLSEKMTTSKEIEINKVAGAKYFMIRLTNEDAAIVVTIVKNQRWKLVVSFYNQVSRQPELFEN